MNGSIGPDEPLSSYEDVFVREVTIIPLTISDVAVHATLKREFARQWIALIVVGSLGFIVTASFVSLWLIGPCNNIDNVVKIIDAIMSPVIGIVGAVTGFYFGESSKSAESSAKNDQT